METGRAAPPDANDLVELTSERRLKNAFESTWYMFYDFPEDHYYQEWQLRHDTNALARILESSEVADRFFKFLLNDQPETRIVWLSETHHITCEGPNESEYDYEGSYSRFQDQMNIPLGQLCLDLVCNMRWYSVYLQNVVTDLDEAPDVVTALLQMAARNPAISCTKVRTKEISQPVGGLEYLMSMASSPRKVEYNPWSPLHPQVQDAMAFRCNPHIKLVIDLSRWHEDKIAVLSNSMLSNRCPRRMVLCSLSETSAAVLAPSLQAATCIEEIAIKIDDNSQAQGFALIMEAIGRNKGICSLQVMKYSYVRTDPSDIIWGWALRSPSIQTIDVEEVNYEAPVTDSQRLDRARSVANNLGDNLVVTRIYFDDEAYDSRIMRERVAPRLKYNRFRPLVVSHGDSATRGTVSERGALISKLLAPDVVRSRPEFLFCLLKANRELLFEPSQPAMKRPSVEAQTS